MAEETRELVEGGVDFFHIDLMDGHYVPNLWVPVEFVRDMKRGYPDMKMDVHMMVTDPMAYVERLAEAGADYISFHTDSTSFVRRTLDRIHACGKKAGVVINPSQRTDSIVPYIDYLDMVTLMAVEPGFSGQPLLPGSVERVGELDALRKQYHAHYLINIDGGVDYETGLKVKELGCDIVIGTRHTIFFQEEGITEACRKFRRILG